MFVSVSFAFDVRPAAEAAEELQAELSMTHSLASRVYSEQDVTVVMVEGVLAVWGYDGRWRWWTGRTDPSGRWIYAYAYRSNPASAARLIMARYTELIAAPSVGTGRR